MFEFGKRMARITCARFPSGLAAAGRAAGAGGLAAGACAAMIAPKKSEPTTTPETRTRMSFTSASSGESILRISARSIYGEPCPRLSARSSGDEKHSRLYLVDLEPGHTTPWFFAGTGPRPLYMNR